ncbi:MAG: S8 family serine peptidase [Candidatus Eremiobacteraeota bacterium]|nr:S8 family serine peptidase [Candidatus Eremiobacteraeota bacterium]
MILVLPINARLLQGILMNHRAVPILVLLSLFALAACGGQNSSSLPSARSADYPLSAPGSIAAPSDAVKVCGEYALGYARCFALRRTDIASRIDAGLTNAMVIGYGYGPAELQSAYLLPSSTRGTGQTVAIVDAFDDPKAEIDLRVYRRNFGLPACTTANGCFKKLNQNGMQSHYPPSDDGWAMEISLDVDMVSAACPKCHIMLVEATDNYLNNLGKAVDTAARLRANAISNSYGGSEFNATNLDYNHPGVIITASSGDSGYGPQQPASYGSVVAVGGTSLLLSPRAETVWNGAGSGCSELVPKPSWQNDAARGCHKRSEADVAAVADPNTGVAAYDSFGTGGGWNQFGGTSVSSPIIAAVYALAGNAATQTAAKQIWVDAGRHLFDVTSGSNDNGSCPRTLPYMCTGGRGYDGPTGWGTPKGVTAF